MKSKIISYLAIVLLIGITIQFFYFDSKISELSIKNTELIEEKKKELKQARDSATAKIDTITKSSRKRFDSIVNLPPKIKWKKYEKPIYIDRSLDDAIRIHSKYKSDTGTKGKNF